MTKYKPIVIEVIYCREEDIIRTSGGDVDGWLENGNAQDFNPGWLTGTQN